MEGPVVAYEKGAVRPLVASIDRSAYRYCKSRHTCTVLAEVVQMQLPFILEVTCDAMYSFFMTGRLGNVPGIARSILRRSMSNES